jgi:hypothetical protein
MENGSFIPSNPVYSPVPQPEPLLQHPFPVQPKEKVPREEKAKKVARAGKAREDVEKEIQTRDAMGTLPEGWVSQAAETPTLIIIGVKRHLKLKTTPPSLKKIQTTLLPQTQKTFPPLSV